jgi:glycosyltransferase involved in cell wall biosynthesis
LIVYDAYEIYSVMVSRRLPKPVVWATRFLERVLPQMADLVITPGEARREYFAALGVRSVAVPNWVDPPRKRASRGQARIALDVPADAFCVVYAGALHASRDLDHLLRWAVRHPKDTVLIAGRGDREAELVEEASRHPNVRLLGWIANPTTLLAAADAVYYALRPDHPYAAYAAPNNLYVAIAHGVPLVYRAQGELATLGREALVGFPFSDDPSLERAMDQLRDPEANRRVRSSLAALRRRYTWKRAARILVDAYPRNGKLKSSPSTNGP